ncbi:MAG TPA: hypothetical protein VJV04_16580 [Nitrospiraceae bacterium]|nr:hypothetical protein [Nitrospiraceae bacterium]
MRMTAINPVSGPKTNAPVIEPTPPNGISTGRIKQVAPQFQDQRNDGDENAERETEKENVSTPVRWKNFTTFSGPNNKRRAQPFII